MINLSTQACRSLESLATKSISTGNLGRFLSTRLYRSAPLRNNLSPIFVKTFTSVSQKQPLQKNKYWAYLSAAGIVLTGICAQKAYEASKKKALSENEA